MKKCMWNAKLHKSFICTIVMQTCHFLLKDLLKMALIVLEVVSCTDAIHKNTVKRRHLHKKKLCHWNHEQLMTLAGCTVRDVTVTVRGQTKSQWNNFLKVAVMWSEKPRRCKATLSPLHSIASCMSAPRWLRLHRWDDTNTRRRRLKYQIQ